MSMSNNSKERRDIKLYEVGFFWTTDGVGRERGRGGSPFILQHVRAWSVGWTGLFASRFEANGVEREGGTLLPEPFEFWRSELHVG